jgi:hypothetical protein
LFNGSAGGLVSYFKVELCVSFPVAVSVKNIPVGNEPCTVPPIVVEDAKEEVETAICCVTPAGTYKLVIVADVNVALPPFMFAVARLAVPVTVRLVKIAVMAFSRVVKKFVEVELVMVAEFALNPERFNPVIMGLIKLALVKVALLAPTCIESETFVVVPVQY